MCTPPYGTVHGIPLVRILEILQRVNTGVCACKRHCASSPPADFFSSFVLFANVSPASFIPLQHPARLPRFLPVVAILFPAAPRGFFFSASPSPRLHAKANTTLIYLPVSAGTRVIYCDLIAFNSSGAIVNHRASRIARVRHACCRYDVITSICGSAMRMRREAIATPLVNG